jgi:two-component system, chemotaxis family, protein-glutamate methylesterase/glutaminase
MSGSQRNHCKRWDLDRLRETRDIAIKMREHALMQRQNIGARSASVSERPAHTSPMLPTCGGVPATLLLTIGGSAGALGTLIRIVASLPESSTAAVAIALHGTSDEHLVALIQRQSALPVTWAASDCLHPGYVYVVPPGRHLIVNPDARLTLSTAPRRRLFRPSIDWLFESAAVSFRERHVAVVLSGRLNDGTSGIRTTHRLGGSTFAQDPDSCDFAEMPHAAIETGCVHHVVPASRLPEEVARWLTRFDDDADLRWREPFTS